MAPLIASLFAQGFSILGNAVLAKGQEAIEEKLGVSLDKTAPLELRRLEVEHEEFLVEAAVRQKELELQDVANARNLGIELSKSSSVLNQNIMPVLALLTIALSMIILITSTENDVKMAATSFITMVLGYFFGSSKGSKDKQEQLYKLQGDQ